MGTAYIKPGDFRVCTTCGCRNKVRMDSCASCGSSLADAVVGSFPPASDYARPGPQLRGSAALKWMLAAGIVSALGMGLFVRSVFRSAAIEEPARPTVTARAHAQPAPAPEAALPYTPVWIPPVHVPPPVVAAPAALPPPASVEPAPASGMVAIAPEPRKRYSSRTAFTNDDLDRIQAARWASGASFSNPAVRNDSPPASPAGTAPAH